MFSVTMFRDAQDVLPRPQTLSIFQLCTLLAPAVPSIRQDLTAEANRKTRILEGALNAVLCGKEPNDRQQRSSWFRALEQIAWVNAGRDPTSVEALVKQKAGEIHDGIHRRLKTRLPCWSPAIYAPRTTRGLEGVVAVSCLVLDYDDGTAPEDALAPWEGHTVLLHSSWSHTAKHSRFRLVLPLAEPVVVDDWVGVWRWAKEKAGGEIDPACKDPSRLYLLPALPSRNHSYFRMVLNQDGPLLQPGTASAVPSQRPPQRAPNPVSTQARRLLNTSQEVRERAASWLSATVRSGRAEHIICPHCGRLSVWFWLAPGVQSTARCKHRNSCGWWGYLDTLLEARGRDVG